MAENNHSSTALPVTEAPHFTEAPRVLVIGDIGQHTYHVGDEAMTIASAEALSEGGAAVTLMTRDVCLLYTSPSPRDRSVSRMPSSA